jgi:hypothetical protein
MTLKKRFRSLGIPCDAPFDRAQTIIDTDWMVRLQNSRQNGQDKGDLGMWAAAEGDEGDEGRAQLAIREQIKEPEGDQPGTNCGVVAAQNCQNVQGGVSLVNVRGLQFGD